jgi:hypothetical protein
MIHFCFFQVASVDKLIVVAVIDVMLDLEIVMMGLVRMVQLS